MKQFFKVTIILIVTIFSLTNNIIANEYSSLHIKDYGNFVKSNNENRIEDIANKVNMLTGISLSVITVDENIEQSKNYLEKDLEEFKNLNSAIVIFYLPSGTIDIKTGDNVTNIFTQKVIEEIKSNSQIKTYFEKSDDEALVYLSTLVANNILIANGFEDIALNEQNTDFQNKVFYIVLGILCIAALFITPISPYKKRKKLSRGESVYAPHSSISEIFHNGIDSDKKD